MPKRPKRLQKPRWKRIAKPADLLSKYMIPAMDEVGKRFEANEFFVPELLIAARAMKTSLELLTPAMAAEGLEAAGRVVIGTVKETCTI